MPALVTTLRTLLGQADEQFRTARYKAAVEAYERLVGLAQDRADRATEVTARAMIARCLIRKRDIDGAREHLQLAAQHLDPLHIESHTRYRAALARLAQAEGPPDTAQREFQEYRAWAVDAGAHDAAVDAMLLLADLAGPEGRIQWLERAADHAQSHGIEAELGKVHTLLGAALEQMDAFDDAMRAYEQALAWHRRTGDVRQIVTGAWAVGATARRLEQWAIAASRLSEAVEMAAAQETCGDLQALAMAELAHVHEASGDVIEARRLVVRALALAREEDLPRFWPERWTALVRHARKLELEA